MRWLSLSWACALVAGCAGAPEPGPDAFRDARAANAEMGLGVAGDTSGGEEAATGARGARAEDGAGGGSGDRAGGGGGGRERGDRAGGGGRKGAIEVREGLASYYADSLAGNTTASGDTYDPGKLTAASRDLPFGTVVRVVRRDARGKSVTVRVNDRGPFGDQRRILDLSRAAAERLGMIRAGVVPIRAEILKLPAQR